MKKRSDTEATSTAIVRHGNIAIHRSDTGYLFRIVGRGTVRESPAVRDFVCGALEDARML